MCRKSLRSLRRGRVYGEVGLQGGLMVKEWIPPALARIHRAYRALGAVENLDVDYFEGKHRWNGVKAYPLLDRVLRP